jgi:hypothetical protein
MGSTGGGTGHVASLACTLLVGAALLTHSFINLVRADRGLDASNVTTMWLSLPATVGDADARRALMRAVENDLRRLPGMRQVAWSYGVPPRRGILSSGDWIPDLPAAQPVKLLVDRYMVSPEFFALYKIPLIRGRSFVASDPMTNVIVSERLAHALWPGRDAIGRTFRFETQQFAVIGIAREINYPSIDARVDGPEYYQPYNTPGSTPMVSLRCDPRCPDPVILRRHLASTHAGIVVQDATPVDVRYRAELARPRASMALAVTFATIALLAAAGGLFSILSYAVTRRRREFGVRAALGASPAEIRRGILREGLLVGAIGLTAGSLVAGALARTLASLQYGTTAADPLTWTVVLSVISCITVAASWAPARTASSADPLALLREE